MATLSIKNPTLIDVANTLDPDGSIAAVAEILNETNDVLPEMVWQEGNLPTGHQSSITTGLPAATWRKWYGGVQPSAGSTAVVTDHTGSLESYAEIDKALADLNGNTAAFRLIEDRRHIESLNQQFSNKLFYGDENTQPEAFTGFAPRYNDLSTANADNIIDAGGTGVDNGSIWLVVWSPMTTFGIYPKGAKAGLQVDDKGQVTIEDADGSNGRMEAYRTHFIWRPGLVVKDWRYVVRIANIDKSNLSNVFNAGQFTAPSAHLPNLMYKAMRLIPSMNVGRASFYMSRDMLTMVQQQTAAAVQGSTLSTENVGGVIVERFHGIPLRRVDTLAANEARVV